MSDEENGRQKAFELAPVRSADEIATEAARMTAPKARRSVNFSTLPMAAKGFFSALTDLTFLYTFGGNGRGKIFASLQELSLWLNNDKDSISGWRNVLVDAKVLWVGPARNQKTEWRILAMCPAPEVQAGELSGIMARASHYAKEEAGSPNLPRPVFERKRKESEPISEGIGGLDGKPSAEVAETFRRGSRNLPRR